jgi:hypothetical protein
MSEAPWSCQEESLMVRRKRGEEAMFPGPRPTHTPLNVDRHPMPRACSCLGAISFTHPVCVGRNTLYSTVHDISGVYIQVFLYILPWRKIDPRTVPERGFVLLADHSPILKNLGSLLARHACANFQISMGTCRKVCSPAQRNMTRVPRWAVRHTPIFVLSESTVC